MSEEIQGQDPYEATENLLRQFREQGMDLEKAQAAMDQHEVGWVTDAMNKSAFLGAARIWREDVVARLTEIERRLDKLEPLD
jgi:hypothetical protein